MTCKGYHCESHEVDTLYAIGLCQPCYMRKYRHEHVKELQAYQAQYCTGKTYREMRRVYMAAYRQEKKKKTGM